MFLGFVELMFKGKSYPLIAGAHRGRIPFGVFGDNTQPRKDYVADASFKFHCIGVSLWVIIPFLGVMSTEYVKSRRFISH